MTDRPKPNSLLGRTARAIRIVAALAIGLLALTPAAHASKQAIDFFGGNGTLGGQFTSSEGVAVNYTGAGGVPAGTAYATDDGSLDFPNQRGNRVQRFQREDNGTPGSTADDTYSFVAAWGAGVLTGGTDYEICTVAASCGMGAPIGGNGTLAGNGSLNKPSDVAVDQDTGQVYVLDSGSRRTFDDNFRINVYSATGAFLRSFGWDVVESGPGNTGTGYEVCVAADGDVCKKGAKGSGLGQLGAAESGEKAAESIAVSPPDGNASTGTVYLADQFNRRINTYSLDGTSPGSIGSAAQFATNQPEEVAVDSRGILYASNLIDGGLGAGGFDSSVLRYDTANANGGGIGFLAPLFAPYDETQRLNRNATAGQFKLSFNGDTTGDLSFDATAEQVDAALEALTSIGAGNVAVGDCLCAEAFYSIRFTGTLASTDVAQIAVSNGTIPLTGTISVTTIIDGHGGVLDQAFFSGLAVDPDSDGPGADTDVLYVGRGGVIQQLGPVNSPGLTAPPSAEDDRHGTSGAFSSSESLAVEPPTGRLYAASGGQAGQGVYVLDNTGPSPTATLDSVDGITADSAELHATIDPNGPPATRYHVEYSTDGVKWLSLPEVLLGAQETPQAVDVHLEPLPIGLAPKTLYHVRVVAGRNFATPIVTNELTFTTLGAPPLAETAGAPVRTTTTAQLNGRVTPLNSATTYHFEYGTDEAYGQSTPSMPAGSGQLTQLVAEEITGLAPDTTYHYRLVADNGVGSPVIGADMAVHTRASNQLPGQSDEFPGPPGSDRAWEQVSIADSSGNPVSIFYADVFADDGNRAIYGIAGGTPISSTGTFISPYFAQRTPSGWQTSLITPPRDQLAGQNWTATYGASDLSTMIAQNWGSDSGLEENEIWRLTPGSSSSLFARVPGKETSVGISADGSRGVAFLEGALDPTYPAATGTNVYDDTGSPQLLSLLPGNLVSPCGTAGSYAFNQQESNWVSEDGSLVYFASRPAPPCGGGGGGQLYLRDVVAAQTKLISGPPLSGPDCGGELIKATPGAAFFATSSRLDADDEDPTGCTASNDVYRYDLGDSSLDCVTCVTPGFDVAVQGSHLANIAVSDDGSRVYFTTFKHLLPGAQPEGQPGIYRVEVESGDLAYVVSRGNVGTSHTQSALSADGSILVFSSDSSLLNPLGGTSDNDGGTQDYRYDDTDRSLVCVSCPQDGSPPFAELFGELHKITSATLNNRSLSTDGSTFAFATPTPLLGADQNTPGPEHNPEAGTDVYEWRDGRLILVTDGLTNWPENEDGGAAPPRVDGVSPTGNDIYILATAAYTPDAQDALYRLYDARIGGGFHFPKPPPPCPLEVCQGIPKGAPEEQEPASGNFAGPGNLKGPTPSRCPKGKRKVSRGGKSRCVKRQRPRKQRRAANHDRRASR